MEGNKHIGIHAQIKRDRNQLKGSDRRKCFTQHERKLIPQSGAAVTVCGEVCTRVAVAPLYLWWLMWGSAENTGLYWDWGENNHANPGKKKTHHPGGFAFTYLKQTFGVDILAILNMFYIIVFNWGFVCKDVRATSKYKIHVSLVNPSGVDTVQELERGQLIYSAYHKQ